MTKGSQSLLFLTELTHVRPPVDGSPVLLVERVDVGSSGQQQLHHLSHTNTLTAGFYIYATLSACVRQRPTSTCPLKAAWCSAVRPARSDTLTLLSSGTKASAQRTALLLAATWSGVCQFLSRAFTSALCLSSTATASWTESGNKSVCVDGQEFYKLPHCK